MLARRLIPCLDVRDGRVVKGVQFRNHVDMGDILDLASRYRDEGADELSRPASRQTQGERSRSVNAWTEFIEGLRYLRKNRLILNAMLQLTTLYCVFAALTVLSIRLAAEFGLKEKQFGFFLAAAGVGMVFGAAIMGHWGDRFHHKPLPLFGFLSMAFVLGVFTFTHNLFLALGLSGLLGVGAALIGVPMQTLIQQQTPTQMHGKVFGFQNHAVNIALSAPLLITERLTNAFGLRSVLIGMSIIVILVGTWAWRNTRRVLRDVI